MRFWILCLAMFFSCASQAKNDNFEYFISNNSNNILTPENIKNISWSGIKAGFAASFQIKNLTSNKVTQTIEYRLERTEGNRHYFDVVIDEDLLSKEKIDLLLKEAQELTAIFIASRKTASNNK